MRKLLTLLAVALVAGAFAASANTAKPTVYLAAGSNQAISGYDAVSYFNGQPERGRNEFTTEYNGAVWRFSTAENRDRFIADPAAFAPQYGGYCAWAVAQGYTAKGDPKVWNIVDGKLYLNFNRNIQSRWSRDIPGNITKANANWPGVLDS